MTVYDRTRWRTIAGTAMATNTTREQVRAAIQAGELPAVDIGGGALRISVAAATASATFVACYALDALIVAARHHRATRRHP